MYFYIVVRADSMLINLVSSSEPLPKILLTISFCRDISQSLDNWNADGHTKRNNYCDQSNTKVLAVPIALTLK
jgi:hypothetical protein